MRRDPAGDAATWVDAWADAFGTRWRLYLASLAALLFVAGALVPLSDIDLPMHLATGEWIVRHRALPMVEPFAWTRAGAPYYASSWAAELLYYGLLLVGGPAALHALHGATLAASGAAVFWLGRVAAWRPWTTALVAALNVVVALTLVTMLRPQGLLFVTVPLAWACVEQMITEDARGRAAWRPLLALFAACALTANFHLFFPLTAAPLALLLARPVRTRGRLLAAAAAAVALGWACNPYVLQYPRMFSLYFAPNALLVSPSPIVEFAPGFSFLPLKSAAAPIAVVLALLPWLTARSDMSARERMVFAALWLAGLVSFAFRVRGLALWWLAVLPLVAYAVDRIPQPGSRRIVRAQRLALAALAALLLLQVGLPAPPRWREEGDATRRRLPTPAYPVVEPLASWLEAHARPGDGGRVLTAFNFGSYLAWRLPAYSASIDGRTLFPDSAAKPEAVRLASEGPAPLGPWRSAELAIVPLRFPVAAVLDTARGWRRVATVDSSARVPGAVGLWVSDAWRARVQLQGAAP